MSLLETIEQIQKANGSKIVGAGGAHNRKRNKFVANMLNHINPDVRLAAASDPKVTTRALQKALQTEEDPTVLKVMLMHETMPLSCILAYVKDSKVLGPLESDPELEDHLVARIKARDAKKE